jgi:hypothetical protein
VEQNGSWKWPKPETKEILPLRISMGMPLSIKPSDIVPVVNTAWKQSLRGCHQQGPFQGVVVINRVFKHPEVLKTKVSQQEQQHHQAKKSKLTAAIVVCRLPPLSYRTLQTRSHLMTNNDHIRHVTNTTVASSSDKSLPKALNLTSGYAGDFVTGSSMPSRK